LIARILLADDSQNAQRLGARILSAEGMEVEVAAAGQEVYPLLDTFQPDVVIADVFLPGRSGYEICHWIKSNPRHRGTRVVLTAGLFEPLDESQAAACGCDAVIKKPFEATEVLQTILPLAEAAQQARGLFADEYDGAPPQGEPGQSPQPPSADPDRIRAAVASALEASMPAIIKEVTQRVLIALGH
jgi:CheY-like chemotaxis protein